MSKNYYDVLGVSKNATEDEIKKAFRKISKENHPDLQSGKSESEKKAAEAKFKDAAEAYETLSSKEKRERYDMMGNGGSQNSNFGSFFRNGNSMFSSFFSHNGFGNNPFSTSNNEAPDPNAPENGRNVQISLNISFKESLFGVSKEFDINLDEVCDTCNGTGTKDKKKLQKCHHCNGTGMYTQNHGNIFIQSTCQYCHGNGYLNNSPCEKCHGTRRHPVKKHISIKIPAGVNTGNKLKIAEKGQSGLNGGKAGDLLINITVQKSDLFERIGNDLKIKQFISPIVASVGGSIDAYSPFGMTTLKIPAGTTNNTIFKIAGKGVRSGSLTGNLLVEVEIEPFTNLSQEQVELLQKLNETISSNNLKKSEQHNKKLANALN